MKKLILFFALIQCFVASSFAQQAYFPTPPADWSPISLPTFRGKANTPDSTNRLLIFNPLTGKSYEIYQGVYLNKNFLRTKDTASISSRINKKLDSATNKPLINKINGKLDSTLNKALITGAKQKSDSANAQGYARNWQLTNGLTVNKSITTTVAGLRSITSPQASVLYQTTDFGGGQFLWDAADTRTDNTGTIIKAAAITTGRFIRIYSGKINIVWFGADLTNTSNSNTAISAAIEWANSLGGGEVYIPTGTFKINSTIFQPYSNITLSGDGNGSVIKPVFTTDSTILVAALRINVQTDYNEASKRISNVGANNFYVDESSLPNIMPYAAVLHPLLQYYGFLNATITAAAIDGLDIHNVTIKNAKSGGFYVTLSYNANLYNDHVEGVISLKYVDPISHTALLYNGNGFSITGADFFGSPSTPYTGPIGNYTITNCTVNGTLSTFPSPLFSGTNLTTGANIGFQIGAGTFNATGNVPNSFILTGCTASNCTWGAMVESEIFGSSYIHVSYNNFHDDLFGVALYGEITNQNWVKGNLVDHNHFKNIYFTPIQVYGNSSILDHNIITDWNIAKKTTPNVTSALAIDGMGAAIYYSPFALGDNSSTQNAKGSIISENHATNNYVPDTSYLVPIAGIIGSIKGTGQTDNDTQLTGNYIDAGGSTNNPTNSDLASGIYLQGRFRHLNVFKNTIIGFPKYALAIVPVGATQTNSATDVTVAENNFHNNGWAHLTNIIHIVSDNKHFDLHDNKLFETNGARMSSALDIQNSSGGASAMDSISYKNNHTWGLAFGDQDYLAINTTSTKVYLENNDGYNYRTAIPTTVTYKSYAGTVIWNTDPSTGILGWICTVSGTPGTWVAFYNKTGLDALYAPIGSVVTPANPSGTQGLSAVNGSASTFMRSDATFPFNQALTPVNTGLWTWQQTIGATPTAAISLNNPTLATASVTQQYSLGLAFPAHVWNNVTLADELKTWLIDNEVSTGNPGNSSLSFRFNGTLIASIGSNGDIVNLTNRYLGAQLSAVSNDGLLTLQARNFTGTQTAVIMSKGTFSGGTGINQSGVAITPVGAQTGSAGMTDFTINRSGTWGSGSQLLADFQVSGSSKWKADQSGNTVQVGTVTATGGSFSGQVNLANAALAIQDPTGTGPSAFLTYNGFKVGTTNNLTHNYTGYNNGTVSLDNGTLFTNTWQYVNGTIALVGAGTTDSRYGQLASSNSWSNTNIFGNNATFNSGSTFNSAITMNQQIVHNSGYQDIYYNLANTFGVTFGVNTLTGNRTATLPDKDGTLVVSTQLPIHGNLTTTGAATTVVTVTIGATQANTTYNATITPRDLLTAVNYYISAQTTTTFDVTFVSAITGSINFDWQVTP